MPVTTATLTMHIAIGFSVWKSQLPMLIKIVVTVILIGEDVLFSYSVWMSESERMRKIGVTLCIAWNTVLIIYALLRKELLLTVSAGILLTFFLIWAFAVVYDFAPKAKRE